MKEINNIVKRGYLKEEFKYFHLSDKKDIQFEAHGHDFYKIIIFINGDVTYLIEGRSYKLEPWDILFIGLNEIHKPFINENKIYERIVIWINPNFLESNSSDNCRLLTCFEIASKQKYNLIRINKENIKKIQAIILEFEDATNSNDFGSNMLKKSLLLQMIVYFTRLLIGEKSNAIHYEFKCDKNIIDIISYINENITEKMSIDDIASRFYMSKYHLMHRFKYETGYTIHNYILQKRLIMASGLIKQGATILDVVNECGFGDYSSFVRAFNKMFGISPKKYYKEYRND